MFQVRCFSLTGSALPCRFLRPGAPDSPRRVRGGQSQGRAPRCGLLQALPLRVAIRVPRAPSLTPFSHKSYDMSLNSGEESPSGSYLWQMQKAHEEQLVELRAAQEGFPLSSVRTTTYFGCSSGVSVAARMSGQSQKPSAIIQCQGFNHAGWFRLLRFL